MQFGYNSMMVAVVFLIGPVVFLPLSIFLGIVVDRFVSLLDRIPDSTARIKCYILLGLSQILHSLWSDDRRYGQCCDGTPIHI